MVQYDQFATILSGKNALPLRGHDLSEVTPRHAETHQTNGKLLIDSPGNDLFSNEYFFL